MTWSESSWLERLQGLFLLEDWSQEDQASRSIIREQRRKWCCLEWLSDWRASRNDEHFFFNKIYHPILSTTICWSGCDFKSCMCCFVLPSWYHVQKKKQWLSCPTCSFFPRFKKREHQNEVHDDQKPFSCPFCDFRGNNYVSFWIHQQFHANGRPFFCDYDGCDFKTKWQHKLRGYKELKHLKTSEFMCHVCDRSNYSNQALEEHIKRCHQKDGHDWETCKECVDLKVDHRRTASGERNQSQSGNKEREEDVPLNDCLVELHKEMLNAPWIIAKWYSQNSVNPLLD